MNSFRNKLFGNWNTDHRWTVIGNPGGGPRGLGQFILRGVLGVVRKSRGSSSFVFYCILSDNNWT